MSLILVSWSGLANRAEAARLSQSIRRSQKDHLLVFAAASLKSVGSVFKHSAAKHDMPGSVTGN